MFKCEYFPKWQLLVSAIKNLKKLAPCANWKKNEKGTESNNEWKAINLKKKNIYI
jgi:hypothetical protein